MSKVTMIVPVYNVEQYIARCLDSLLAQDYADYEIICVDDKSPDNCLAILKDYEKKYPNKLRVMENEENMGQGRSRMRAVSEANGEFVMFVDSDDYVARDYISTYMTEMKKHPCDVVTGGFTRDVEGKLTAHRAPGGAWSLLVYAISCGKLYRKQFLQAHCISFSDIRCGEDIYFNLSLFYHEARVRVIDYAGYYYYCNNNSTTRAMNYDSNHECFVSEIYDKFMADHDLSTLSEKRYRGIEYTYVANMINALITYGHGCKPKRMKEKYDYVMKDMQRRFPTYRDNPFYGMAKPKAVNAKVRLGVGVMMGLQKIHLDLAAYKLISLL
ncbi:MAG: glycosyltransferase family 2 protein [Eubacteriales bacterium]|nr:glycosyltransferase family 2 protein [Eubacteriales bacterium]